MSVLHLNEEKKSTQLPHDLILKRYGDNWCILYGFSVLPFYECETVSSFFFFFFKYAKPHFPLFRGERGFNMKIM